MPKEEENINGFDPDDGYCSHSKSLMLANLEMYQQIKDLVKAVMLDNLIKPIQICVCGK